MRILGGGKAGGSSSSFDSNEGLDILFLRGGRVGGMFGDSSCSLHCDFTVDPCDITESRVCLLLSDSEEYPEEGMLSSASLPCRLTLTLLRLFRARCDGGFGAGRIGTGVLSENDDDDEVDEVDDTEDAETDDGDADKLVRK